MRNEAEPMLKEIPMFTADEYEIELNSILYRAKWSEGYKRAGKGEIEALRVFFVNNAARTFRAKCIRGCEEIYKFSDGCSTKKLYAKLSNAVKELGNEINESLEDYEKELSKQQAIVDGTRTELAKAKRIISTDVKIPKAVNT